MLPAGVTLLRILESIGRQLLQQQTAGATTVGIEPETRRQLLGSGEVVGQAGCQVDPLQPDDALITLAVGRVDGDRQHAFGHQLAQRCTWLDLLGVIAGDATHFARAGTLDHQQRHGTAGAGLEDQQPVKLERADQQRGRGQQLAEQLGHRFWIGVLGEHVLVAFLERGDLAANIGIIEEKTLGLIGHSRKARRYGGGSGNFRRKSGPDQGWRPDGLARDAVRRRCAA